MQFHCINSYFLITSWIIIPLITSQQLSQELFKMVQNNTDGSPSAVTDFRDVPSSFFCARSCVNNINCLGFSLASIDESNESKPTTLAFHCHLLHSLQEGVLEVKHGWKLYGIPGLFPAEIYSSVISKGAESTSVNINGQTMFNAECWDKAIVSYPGILVAVLDSTSLQYNDVDRMKCLHLENGLALDQDKKVHIHLQVSTAENIVDGVSQCPDNHVITALLDKDSLFQNVDYATCVSLTNGWEIDYSDCWVQKRLKQHYLGSFDPNMTWNFECPRSRWEIKVVVGYILNGDIILKCCTLKKMFI
ncbi:uncharacterized protein LOC143240828 [Tachypleus tridentatus]|uniref:uncharacterized protein LOC143240828 n=1 Tax=Tachypleus tridentatus TaxID=6853 RepID=UPI003FD64D1F